MNRRIMLLASLLTASVTAQGATLTGSVQSNDGESIAARISILRHSPGREASLETHDTEDDGTFSIEADSTGLVAIAASATGYASHEIGLTGGVPSGSLRFTLHPQQFIQGTIQGPAGELLVGAETHVRNPGAAPVMQLDHYATDTTDADGKFMLAVPGNRVSEFVIDVLAEGWIPQSKGLGSGAVGETGVGTGTLESVLIELESQGATVSGKVTSPSGSALRDITVLANVKPQAANVNDGAAIGGLTGPGSGPAAPSRSFRTRTVTGSDGSYELSGLPLGTLRIVAIKRGARIPVQQHNLTEGDSVTADFVVPD